MAHSCLSPPHKLPPLRASLCRSVSSMWCHCSLQPRWSHNHHRSLCKYPCPLPISGDQALFAWTSRISVCTHSGEQLVVWWALLWHLVFRGHKGQSLLGYYTSTAFIWNLVHTKLMGLDLAPPKFNPEKKVTQEEFEQVQYLEQGLFLLTEQVTQMAKCPNTRRWQGWASRPLSFHNKLSFPRRWTFQDSTKTLGLWAWWPLSRESPFWLMWYFGKGSNLMRLLYFVSVLIFTRNQRAVSKQQKSTNLQPRTLNQKPDLCSSSLSCAHRDRCYLPSGSHWL